MRAMTEPAFWLGVFLLALGLGLIAVGAGPGRAGMAAALGTGAVLTAISVWAWWRTTETFMQFLRDFRRLAPQK
jgi:ABC-type glycerol-3-phosphate transport system substrate-binding protein